MLTNLSDAPVAQQPELMAPRPRQFVCPYAGCRSNPFASKSVLVTHCNSIHAGEPREDHFLKDIGYQSCNSPAHPGHLFSTTRKHCPKCRPQTSTGPSYPSQHTPSPNRPPAQRPPHRVSATVSARQSEPCLRGTGAAAAAARGTSAPDPGTAGGAPGSGRGSLGTHNSSGDVCLPARGQSPAQTVAQQMPVVPARCVPLAESETVHATNTLRVSPARAQCADTPGPPALSAGPSTSRPAGPSSTAPHTSVLPPPRPPEHDEPTYEGRPPQKVSAHTREQWGETVAHLLDSVNATLQRGHMPSIKVAVRKLLALPCQVLPDNGSSRGRARRQVGRLKQIINGEPLRAMSETGPAPIPNNRVAPDHKTAKQLHRHLANGNVSRAAKTLTSSVFAEPTDETLAMLRDLHPTSAPPQIPPPAADTECAQVSEELMERVLARLPKGRAAGPSGWTYEHIQAATNASPRAREAARTFVNTMLAGDVPHLPDLLDSRLVAFAKPAGGVRPIAIGETWLRLGCLCGIAATPDIGPTLAPLQFCSGVPGGTQCLIQGMRLRMMNEPDVLTVGLDFKNAFNTLDRTAALQATKKRVPGLLPICAWMQARATRLLPSGFADNAHAIDSTTGVLQGNPLSMLQYAATVQDALEETARLHPTVAVRAYADDTYLQASSVPSAVAATRTLLDLCQKLGLLHVPRKCFVHSSDAALAEAAADQLGFQHKVEGFVAGGAGLGSGEFVTDHAQSIADKACERIDRLLSLPASAQDKWLILSMSAQRSMDHLLRVVPWNHLVAAKQTLEDKVLEAALLIAGIPEYDEDTDAQLCLPLRLGGFNLQSVSQSGALAAYVSSAATAHSALQTSTHADSPFGDSSASDTLRGIWSDLHDRGGGLWPDNVRDATDTVVASVLPNAQRDLARHEAELRFQKLLNRPGDQSPEAKHHRARLLSVSCAAASRWLTALPIAPCMRLRKEEVQVSMRLRLGKPLLPANAPDLTCFCKKPILRGDKDHAMACSKCGDRKLMRHNMITDQVRQCAARAGISTALEPTLRGLRGAQTTESSQSEALGSRGDILVALADSLTVVDVTVVHPCAASYVDAAARTAGAAAERREREKRRRYQRDEPDGYSFTGFVVESLGRIGKEGMSFLNTLADKAAESGDVQRGEFMRNALTAVSVALCKGNAGLVRANRMAMAKASGRQYMAGWCQPSDQVG